LAAELDGAVVDAGTAPAVGRAAVAKGRANAGYAVTAAAISADGSRGRDGARGRRRRVVLVPAETPLRLAVVLDGAVNGRGAAPAVGRAAVAEVTAQAGHAIAAGAVGRDDSGLGWLG